MAQVESSKYVNVSVGIRRYGSFHNFTMEIVFDILLPLNNLKMNMGYFVRSRNSEYWMYNKTYDFCAFLERTSIDRFGSLVVDDFKYRGKVPKRCPIMPERLVYKNVTFNRVKLPSFLPETKYGFTADCFKGPKNEYVFRSLWHGILKRIMA
uniref:Uncharacterized protein n=1 Tax=Anopheles funestus TaxID=62324 RepID=A0A4Y0BP56_ANOFN